MRGNVEQPLSTSYPFSFLYRYIILLLLVVNHLCFSQVETIIIAYKDALLTWLYITLQSAPCAPSWYLQYIYIFFCNPLWRVLMRRIVLRQTADSCFK